MFYLTETQVIIIELLAIYGYLTSSQVVKMGLLLSAKVKYTSSAK
jgi:hypothetical protein